MAMEMKTNVFIDRLTKIRMLNKKYRETFVNKDLYRLLKRRESLVAGYEKIKMNNAAIIRANEKISDDALNETRLTRLQEQLDNESWKPKSIGRIFVSKSGKTTKTTLFHATSSKRMEKRGRKGNKKCILKNKLGCFATCPFGQWNTLFIQGLEEKIVQSTICLILESIYEPVFHDFSFGFRPNRGVHDALKKIQQTFSGMTFAIEGHVKGMYDKDNHHILIQLMEKRIKDPRFIQLMWKMLRAGYMIEVEKIDSAIETPQRSIVSPILANIYLHEYDCFMKSIEQKEGKPTSITTPQHKTLLNRTTQLKKKTMSCDTNEEKNLHLQQQQNGKRKSLSVRVNFPVRVVYIRYADDFIVGIAGTSSLALEIKDRIKAFLKQKLNLTYNEEKSKVRLLRKEKAFFLGHCIWIQTKGKIKRVHKDNHTPYLKPSTGYRIKITAHIQQIVQKLQVKNFCDRKGRPKAKQMWITQEDNQIIQLFNCTIRQLFDFYSGAQKKRSLSRIWYILLFSCSHTLASKHRSTLRKIFTKHGKNLRVHYGSSGEKYVELYKPDLKEKNAKWCLGKTIAEPYRCISHKNEKTKLFESCCK